MADLTSGYAQRAIDRFPRQGPVDPWRVRHNYALDLLNLRRTPIDDGTMRFSAPPDVAAGAALPDAATVPS